MEALMAFALIMPTYIAPVYASSEVVLEPREFYSEQRHLVGAMRKSKALGADFGAHPYLRQLAHIQQNKTPEQIKEKLGKVLVEKVIRKPEDNLDVQASLPLDNPNAGPKHFDVSVKYENLKDDLQKQARSLGFVKGDKLTVRVDATTWEPRVLSTMSFSAEVQEFIPSKEPGGRPSIRAVARFDVLTPQLKSRARELGYREGDMVNLLAKSPNAPLEVLPRTVEKSESAPSFRLGMKSTFDKLNKDEQKRALKLGYKEGDTVWREYVKDKFEIVPAARVGDGPEIELLGGRINPVTQELSLIGLAKFKNLSPSAQEAARRLGYKEGDNVGYEVKRGGESVMLAPRNIPRVP